MAMPRYGTEVAGCLTARGDSSPCADRGQNIVCMTGTQAHCHISDEIAGCLTAHMGKDDAPVAADGTNIQAYVCPTPKCGGDGAMVASETADKTMEANPMLVRRLTPLECERLRGFPDGHTLIGWKGRPAEECPDGPRCKAIGNSMAVPVMRWLGERIEEAGGLFRDEWMDE